MSRTEGRDTTKPSYSNDELRNVVVSLSILDKMFVSFLLAVSLGLFITTSVAMIFITLWDNTQLANMYSNTDLSLIAFFSFVMIGQIIYQIFWRKVFKIEYIFSPDGIYLTQKNIFHTTSRVCLACVDDFDKVLSMWPLKLRLRNGNILNLKLLGSFGYESRSGLIISWRTSMRREASKLEKIARLYGDRADFSRAWHEYEGRGSLSIPWTKRGRDVRD